MIDTGDIMVAITFASSVWLGFSFRRRHREIRMPPNERAIEEAKALYAAGVIELDDLQTRVGHLHDWDGTP
jgi:hypothetical protein